MRNLQRLLRGCLFGLAASAGGRLLARDYRRWPGDLLQRYPAALTPLLEGTIAHWVLTLYEENSVGSAMVGECGLV